MINKQIYPKTKRLKSDKTIIITEKLDGSNIGFFKLNGELHIAQRNTIYKLSEIDNDVVKNKMYGGLYGWLQDNGENLQNSLYENSCAFGEWIGMGKIKYPTFDKKSISIC